MSADTLVAVFASVFLELLFIMSYLFKTSFELRNTGAGNCVHVAAVASLQKVVGNACNHSTIVSAKFEGREDAVEVASFGQHFAKAGISRNTTATDNCFETGVICGF